MTIRSRKTLVVLSLCLFGAAALALGSVALIGSRVSSEIQRYQALLIERDDVSVVQFDYNRNFWGGELRYRLLWRPERGEGPLAQWMRTLEMSEERLTLTGIIDIRHGPWLGEMAFGLARADLEIAVPAMLREALPQYPGQAPLITLTGTLGFSGALRARLDVQDYDGRVADGANVANFELFGVGAEVVVNRALDQLDLRMEVPLMALDAPGEGNASLEALLMAGTLNRAQAGWSMSADIEMGLLEVNENTQDDAVIPLFAMDQLSLQATLSQRESEPLLSDSRMTLEAVRLNLPSASLELALRDYVGSSRVGLLDDTVENTGTLRVGSLELNQERLGGIALESSLRGISAQTYMALEGLWSLETDLDNFDETLVEALRALAQEQIVLSVDRFVLSLPDEDDVVASLSLEYTGSAQVNVDSLESITNAIQVEGSVDASIKALERTFASEALSQEQQETLQGLLDSVQTLPYVTIDDDRLRSSVQASAQQVLINGEPVEAANALIAATTNRHAPDTTVTEPTPSPATMPEPAPVAPGSVSKTLAPEPAALCPDFSLSGTSLQYTSDALYTPQSLKVFAGGSVDIGQCPSLPGSGFVTQAPDYTLALTDNGNRRALEVRLASECDSVLLINDPLAAWHFDDDSNGSMDALIRFDAAAEGTYDIWIGSYNSDGCNASVTLETF